MADQRRHSLRNPQGKDQNDDEKRNHEQRRRDSPHPPSPQASATPVSHNETHTPMDWDTTDRKTRDQSDHHLTSTDVERRENRASCQDVLAHTSGDVVGTETHTSVQSQETSFRDSENQLVETRTTTQVGEKNTVINKTINTYKGNHNHNHNHVHNHFHYSCPPPPHHHGDSSSSYHVPCPDCLPYHHNDHPPLVETHRPQPESEPRHLGLPPPVPQRLPGPQQTQYKESSQERVAQNNIHRDKKLKPDRVLQKPSTTSRPASSDVIPHVATGQQEEKLAVKSKDKPDQKPSDSKPRSQETVRQSSRASDVTPRPNVTRAEQRVRQEARTGKTADREKKENGQSQNTKTASESAETRRVCNEGVRDTLCILDSQGQALEPGDPLWIGSPYIGKRAVYVGSQQVVYSPGRDEMVVKKELAMTNPFGKMTVCSKGECPVYSPRQRVERATAMIGERYTEGEEGWLYGWDFLVWVFTGLGFNEAHRKGFSLIRFGLYKTGYNRRESDSTLGDWE